MSASARHRPLVAAPAVVAAVVVVGLLAGCGDDDGAPGSRRIVVVSPSPSGPSSPSSSALPPGPPPATGSSVPPTASPSARGSATSLTPQELFDEVSDGVLRISSAGCDGVATGSGLLVDDDLLLTVGHVVEGGGAVSVRIGTDVRRAAVVAYDLPHELALLRLDDPLPGHVFTLANGSAAVGATAHVLGYPRGGPLSLTTGTVSGVDRRLPLGDRTLTGLLQVDAPISHGNSGGPVVDGDGVVLGLAEAAREGAQNVNYAVPAVAAARFVAAHEGAATPVDTSACDDPASTWSRVAVDTDDPGAEVVAATFANYADALDLADLAYAWALLTPEVQQRSGGYDTWAAGLDTSSLHDLAVESVTPVDPTTDVARIRMVSTQAPEDGRAGQTCSVWHLDYRLVLDIGYYQIDRATPRDGSPQPCSPSQAAEATSAP